jgi:hypothetical protein
MGCRVETVRYVLFIFILAGFLVFFDPALQGLELVGVGVDVHHQEVVFFHLALGEGVAAVFERDLEHGIRNF